MIGVIYFVLFLILLFLCFIVLLKSLDILYLKSFFKTITCLLIVFFTIVFPFLGTYCIAKILSHQEVITFFESTFLGEKITTFFQVYFLPLYLLFSVVSILIMVHMILGKMQKRSTKPILIPDGPNVKNDKIKIADKDFLIRPLTKADMHYLMTWLTDEKVLEYHDGRDVQYDEKLIQKQYYNQKNVARFILEKGKETIGYLQYYPLTRDELNKFNFGLETIVYGVDYFIGIPKYFRRNYGVRYMSMLRDYLFSHDVDLLVVDPLIENKRDISCYEKCGFQTYRVLPHHRRHEGEFHDCYLMVCSKQKIQSGEVDITNNQSTTKKKKNSKRNQKDEK